MNFFSSDAFLQSLAEGAFPGRACTPTVVEVAGQPFRVLEVAGKGLITDWPFLDFLEPLASKPDGRVRRLGYLPRAAFKTLPAEGKRPDEIGPGLQPAPFLDWTQVSTPEAFEQLVAARRSRVLGESVKREKKLVEKFGPVRYLFHDDREEAFTRCVTWKAAQYARTGGTDKFFRDNLGIFRGLMQRGLLQVHSLCAGDRFAAVTWSVLYEGRLSYWVASYDPELGTYSPGRLLLHWLLRESQRLGHREFDLLIGDEEYKWHYASHTRVVEPWGTAPWTLRLQRAARTRAKGLLSRYPALLEKAQALKKRLSR